MRCGRGGGRGAKPGLAFALALALALGLAGALTACTEPGDASRRPDVVLIVVDTLRADHLPFYGYHRNTAPFLASLAARGAVFERVTSSSSATAPATASLFTSLHPLQHGVVHGLMATRSMQEHDHTIELNRIAEELTTLPEALQQAGYATFGITDNLNICKAEGFAQGFDRFANFRYRSAAWVNRVLFGWEEQVRAAAPYFLYLHYMDPHAPYAQHQPAFDAFDDGTSSKLVAAYDSEIAFVDGKIEEAFRRFGWDENTLVIVTADHGEAFREHGHLGHGQDLFQEVVHVPLLVFEPGAVEPQRIAERVQTLDVYPTLLELLDLSVDAGRLQRLQGVSHAARLRRAGAPADAGREVVSQLVRKEDGRVASLVSAVAQGHWKYIRYAPTAQDEAPVEMLFDLGEDPGEQESRLEEAKVRERLSAELARHNRAKPEFPQASTRYLIDEATRRHLEELGYVDE